MATSIAKYSIIIPAYKEASLIDDTLLRLSEYLKNESLWSDTEVLIIAADGGDTTAKKARAHSKEFMQLEVIEPGPKVGKGRDVRLGMLSAKGEYVLFMDADLATPLHHIKTIFTALEQGNDVAIGQRDLSKIHSGSRLIGSMSSNLLIQLVLLPGYRDTQCGFKAFTRDAVKTLFTDLKTTGWGFDFELLARANVQKYKIAKIDIPDWTDPKAESGGLVGESNLTALKNTFKELCRVKWHKVRGDYT